MEENVAKEVKEVKENVSEITLKVAGGSSPIALATSIVKNIQEGKKVDTISIGAGSLNQAIKGIIIARSKLAAQGKDLLIKPGFVDLMVEGKQKTAIKLSLII